MFAKRYQAQNSIQKADYISPKLLDLTLVLQKFSFIGCKIFLLIRRSEDLVEHLTPALFGLIGVLIGGLISFGTQFYFLLREESRQRRQRVSSIMFKLKMICDDVFTASETIRKYLPEKPTGQLWGHIRSVVGLDLRHIDFSSEELSCLRTEKRVVIQDFLQLTAARRRSINTLMQAYSDLKKEHESQSTKLIQINPTSDYQKVMLNTVEHPDLVVNMMQLNSMAFEVIDMLNEFFREIKEHQEDFVFVVQRTSKNKKLSFKLPNKELEISVKGYSKSIGDYAI